MPLCVWSSSSPVVSSPWLLQASLSVTILFVSYIVQQRVQPYVNLNAIAMGLGITADNIGDRLAQLGASSGGGTASESPTSSRPSSLLIPSEHRPSRLGLPDTDSGRTSRNSRVHAMTASASSRSPAPWVEPDQLAGDGSVAECGPLQVVAPTPTVAATSVRVAQDQHELRGQAVVGTPTSSPGGPSTHECGIATSEATADSVREVWGRRTDGAGAGVPSSNRRRSTMVVAAGKYTRRMTVLAQRRVRTVVYTGVVNYNHLESSFLISAVLIMMLGMVFSSNGIAAGSALYALLAGVTATIIVVAIASFAVLMVFEVFRSLKFIALNDVARKVEVEEAERAAMGVLFGRQGTDSDGRKRRKTRRRSSLVERFRRSSLRRMSGVKLVD